MIETTTVVTIIEIAKYRTDQRTCTPEKVASNI